MTCQLVLPIAKLRCGYALIQNIGEMIIGRRKPKNTEEHVPQRQSVHHNSQRNPGRRGEKKPTNRLNNLTEQSLL